MKSYTVLYPHASFPVDVRLVRLKASQDCTFLELVEKISKAFPGHSDDIKEATIWKASGLARAEAKEASRKKILEWIQGREGNSEAVKMLRENYLGEIFPQDALTGGPKWVDIIVLTPEIIEDVDQLGDLDFNYQRKKARVSNSRTSSALASPSDCVKDASTIRKTVNDIAGPRYGRPSDRYGPPTALFNRELAILKYDLDHLEVFTPGLRAVDDAFRLVSHSAAFYSQENEREIALRSFLRELLPGVVQRQQSVADKSAKPDGVWFEGDFAYLILEIKNEQGLGGDPFLQSLIVYKKIIGQPEYAKMIPRSNLPIVLLSVAGNRLEVSTAIYTNAAYADKLLSIELMLGLHAQENVLRVARIFAAVSKCMKGLRFRYRSLSASTEDDPSIEFPSPTPYPSNPALDPLNPALDPSSPAPNSQSSTPNRLTPSEEIGALKFFCKLDRVHGTGLVAVDEENERHAIYLARRTIGSTKEETVLVKFAPKYHEDAHRLLADQNPPLAPTLYSCTRVIGDLYMVVMEYLQDAKPLYTYLPPYPHPPPLNVEAIRLGLNKALDLLHERELVFGDLREANVLYLPKDGGRAFLIDFDGVGKHGKDRFSPCLNLELDLGVVRWQTMEKSHDLSNFGDLISRLLAAAG